MGEYRVIKVDSWGQYHEIIQSGDYRGWAFRGHKDRRWPLRSCLSRYLEDYGIDRRAWRRQEERILRIFKRKAHLFLQHVPADDDSFQWLALMQHHGAPTRLLDFTWSPYVALFFALERAQTDAAVWALRPSGISVMAEQRIRGGHVIHPLEADPRLPGTFERYYLEGKTPFVMFGEPRIMNQRLIAQSATFAIPGVLDEPIERILADYPSPHEIMAKFELGTSTMRDGSMRALYDMNITSATLFPDLDGLARSLGYELEFHWAFNPKTMEPFPGFPGPGELPL